MQEKKLHALSTKTIAQWKSINKEVTIFYGMWNAQTNNPRWEYAAEIKFDQENILYLLMGHGIGRNKKVYTSCESLIHVIEHDNKRFNRGEQMYFRIG